MKAGRNIWVSAGYVVATIFTATLMFAACAPKPTSFDGYWAGTATVGTEPTRFALRVVHQGDELAGTIDLPDVGALEWPAQTTTQQGPTVRVEFPSDRGMNVLTATISGDSVVGRWAMAGERDTAIVSLARAALPPMVRTEGVAFHGTTDSTVTLRGTVVLPEGDGPWPGVVFVHGAGDESRDASRFLATYYAQHGIASLIYDKRGVGESGGDWHRADFDVLADDALAAANLLRHHEGIDTLAIGLRGQSQGGWVAPLAASKTHDVAFVVTVAGPLVTPAEEGHWDAIFALRAAGYDARAIDAAESLLVQRDRAVRSRNWDSYRRALADARQQPWFKASGIDINDDPSAWIWEWYRLVMDFDPVPMFEQLAIPVLAQFGADDESIPAAKSAAILERMRDQTGKPYTITVYPSTNHSMRSVANRDGFHWPVYTGGYLDQQVEWIKRQAVARAR